MDEPIAPEAAGTLTGLFRLRVSRTPRALAYRQFENGRWRDYRWHEIAAEVARWRAGLAAEGFAIGDRVAMSLPNGVDWVCFDQAALTLGLVTVPLYTTDSPGNLAHILADSGARLVLLDSDAPWAALVAQADPLPALQRVLFRRLTGAVPGSAPGSAPSSAQDPRLRTLDDWLPAKPTSAATAEMEQTLAKAPSTLASRSGFGSGFGSRFGSRSGSTPRPTSHPTSHPRSHPRSHPSSHPASLASQSEFDSAADPDELATLVYTSGTTGRSKGVMLSHRNILTNAAAVIARIPPRPSDVFLSFLPLAHAFERTVGHYLPMMAGCTIAYARSIDQLRDDLMTIRPTVLLSVPRVYDKVYLAIQGKLGSEGIQRRLLDTTVRIGWQRFQANQGRQAPLSLMDQIRWSLLDRLVARKIRGRLGGRLRVAVSGGAPLSATVGRFFVGLGLPLTEGYGLTEAAPVVTGTTPPGFRPGWVGPPLPGVEVRLGAQQELCVRGPNVCAGYWQQTAATAQAIDAEGWLHTGDIGEIDDDGFIGIRGRLKEIIVTSTGEKIPPTEMESALTMEPLFDQAMVVGEGRQFLAAVLVLSDAPWRRLAARLGLDPDDPSSLADPLAIDAALTRAAARLSDFPGYAQVHAVHLTRSAWTIDNGLITPTMKLKRPELMAEFGPALEALYSRPRPALRGKSG
ncbi:AMP-binding protein [Halochromatium glycolicum]|uniref:AMP-binding protein n=1 Tax=Halochromatium glycolicum TaxID=85075 RepID=UPI001909CC5E